MKQRTRFDFERTFTGMRGLIRTGNDEWDIRQAALGIPPATDVLEMHEIVFMERFVTDLGQHFQWIPKDERKHFATCDFYWVEQQAYIELKSTRSLTPKYSSVSSQIRQSVIKARKWNVEKRSFLLDLYGARITEKFIYQISHYNEKNPDNRISDLWLADERGLEKLI